MCKASSRDTFLDDVDDVCKLDTNEITDTFMFPSDGTGDNAGDDGGTGDNDGTVDNDGTGDNTGDDGGTGDNDGTGDNTGDDGGEIFEIVDDLYDFLDGEIYAIVVCAWREITYEINAKSNWDTTTESTAADDVSVYSTLPPLIVTTVPPVPVMFGLLHNILDDAAPSDSSLSPPLPLTDPSAICDPPQDILEWMIADTSAVLSSCSSSGDYAHSYSLRSSSARAHSPSSIDSSSTTSTNPYYGLVKVDTRGKRRISNHTDHT